MYGETKDSVSTQWNTTGPQERMKYSCMLSHVSLTLKILYQVKESSDEMTTYWMIPFIQMSTTGKSIDSKSRLVFA